MVGNTRVHECTPPGSAGRLQCRGQFFDPEGLELRLITPGVTVRDARRLVKAGALVVMEECGCGGVRVDVPRGGSTTISSESFEAVRRLASPTATGLRPERPLGQRQPHRPFRARGRELGRRNRLATLCKVDKQRIGAGLLGKRYDRRGNTPKITLAPSTLGGRFEEDGFVEPIPLSVFEAAVQVAGSALHYKSSLKQLLRNSGVSENGAERYSDLTKYQIFRNTWGDLDRAGMPGRRVQQRLVAALANLDKPDPNVPDVAAGQRAIADLRRQAQQANLLVAPEDLARNERRKTAATAAAETISKRAQLAALNKTFHTLHGQSDKQRRGYDLEKLLAALFRWAELDYHGSYRTETDQIDGAIILDSFTYLIEARWRDEVAVATDLAAFADKVERRIDATRGLFISMAGFRPAAVDRYRQSKENRLVLCDGSDLAWILEGRFDFTDALRAKVRAASIQGDPYVSVHSF